MNEIKGTGSREENETVVVFNDSEDDAAVNTASPTVYRRLVKAGYTATRHNENRARFVLPKRDIRLPRPKRTMSDAQRAIARKGGFKPGTRSPERIPAQTPSSPPQTTANPAKTAISEGNTP